MKEIAIGTRFRDEVMPSASDLASAIGNRGVDVVSSPATIGYLEMACHNLILPAFEADEASVGVGFSFRHLAAAHPNGPVEVESELIARDDRKFTFRVEARQAGRSIMTGEHMRVLVNLSRFVPGRSDGGVTGPELTFWFDIHSPWAYLAAHRIGSIAKRHGCPLAWQPLQLPRLIEAIDGRRPLEENAAFVAWYKQDLLDYAELQNVEVRYHPDFPLRNSRALRVCLYARDNGLGEEYFKRLGRGYWSEAADITDPKVLGEFAEEAGLDGGTAAAAATDEGLKARLQANTAEAIRRGVFGVPTVEMDGKLYFGIDRLDLLDRHLMLRGRE